MKNSIKGYKKKDESVFLLKLLNEKIDNIVYLNPGACGRKRFSLPLSMAIVEINLDDIKIEKIDLN